MTCTEFLACYSDWRDGLVLDATHRRAFERHLAVCRVCGAYDRVVRSGVRALRSLGPHVPASPSFSQQLEARLQSGAPPDPLLPAWSGVAAALLLLCAVAVAALDLGRHRTVAATRAEAPTPVANAGMPFVTFQHPKVTVLVYAPDEASLGPAARSLARTAVFR